MADLLALDYLVTKRNQALRDVESLSVMIAEIEKLVAEKAAAEKRAAFLRITHSSETRITAEPQQDKADREDGDIEV